MSEGNAPEDKRIPIKPPKLTGAEGRVIRAPRYTARKAPRAQPAPKPAKQKQEEVARPKDPFVAKEKPVPLAPRIQDPSARRASPSSRRKARAPVLVGLGLIAAVLFGYQIGAWRQRVLLTGRGPVSGGGATPQELQPFDSIVRDLQLGETASASASLSRLQKAAPQMPSLQYLAAVAALAAGDYAAATSAADASIARGERVSDSLVLRATAELKKHVKSGNDALGRVRERAEVDLSEAMLADPSNYLPYMSLAALRRQEGQERLAKDLLESARARLTSPDPRASIDAQILLIRLSMLPDHQLPDDLDPDKDVPSLVGSAYVAMRRGNFTRAAELLATARRRLPKDLCATLLSDPVFRDYVSDQSLAPAFRP